MSIINLFVAIIERIMDPVMLITSQFYKNYWNVEFLDETIRIQ